MGRNYKRKAIIEIGSPDRDVANDEWDIYYYPNNIAEWEFIDEVRHLREHYEVLVLPVKYPAHIRKNIIEIIFRKEGI